MAPRLVEEHSLSGLPSELLLRILEEAMVLSRAVTIALCAVSSWTRRLALPRLLATVVLKRPGEVRGFVELFIRSQIMTQKGPLCAPLVQNLWVSDTSMPLLLDIASSCTNLARLALFDTALTQLVSLSDVNSTPDLLHARFATEEDGLSLTVVGIVGVVQLQLARYSAICLNTTHLRLHHITTYPDPLHETFPRLTHFATVFIHNIRTVHFSLDTLVAIERSLTESPEHFQAFVLVLSDATLLRSGSFKAWLRRIRTTDKRLRVVTGGTLSHEWRDEINGGESVWDRATRTTAELEETTGPTEGALP